MSRTRILIADDHRLIAEASARMLQPEFDVVGVVSDGRALVQAALELKPDVAIIDISMPQLNGLSAAEQIKSRLPKLKVVFLTVNSDVEMAAEAFRRGSFRLRSKAHRDRRADQRNKACCARTVLPFLPGRARDPGSSSTQTAAPRRRALDYPSPNRDLAVAGGRTNHEADRKRSRHNPGDGRLPQVSDDAKAGHYNKCRFVCVRDENAFDSRMRSGGWVRTATGLPLTPVSRYLGIGPDRIEMEGTIRYDVAVLLECIRRNTRVASVRAAMEEAREAV